MPILGSSSSGAKGAPVAPTIGTATLSGTSASVTFSAPSFSKLPITSYTVTSSPGSLTGTGVSSPITVSGLTAGTSYTFTVTASTSNGVSSPSAASNSVTPQYSSLIITTKRGNMNPSQGSVVSDSSGNTYLGSSYDDNSGDQYVYKFNSSGSLVYQAANTSAASTYGANIAVSSSNQTYLAYGDNGLNLTIRNSSGSVTSAYNYTNATLPGFSSVVFDDSQNSFFVGQRGTTGHITKIDSTGTFQWGKTLSSTSSFSLRQVDYDAAGNIYAAGAYDNASTGTWETHIVKYDSSGTLQWHRFFNNIFAGVFPRTMSVNKSTGDIYVTLSVSPFSIVKINSSGVAQWTRGFGANEGFTSRVDSSNNLYLMNYINYSNTIGISKWNSSGTLQWQRSISNSNSLTHFSDRGSLSITPDGSHLLISLEVANATPTYGTILLKVPTDGSKTGTYSNLSSANFTVVYAASSQSENSQNHTLGTPSGFTASTYTVTRSNVAVTNTTPSSVEFTSTVL
jgi:hypothetical protein